ncbi:MAG: SPOR domain-containing protein, partial [Pseudomonadota bacterium]
QPGETDSVLTGDGSELITASVPVTGVNVFEAENYEDLDIYLDGEGAPDWTLQFSSHSNRADADRALFRLRDQGIDATIFGQVIGNTGFFIVRAGDYTSREAALDAAEQIQADTGLRPYVVTPGS